MLSQISNSTMLEKCNDIISHNNFTWDTYEEIVNSCNLHYNVKRQVPFMSSEIKINLNEKKGGGSILVNNDNYFLSYPSVYP